MFQIIHSLYENVKSCVKHNGLLSDYFPIEIGLFQGEVLSPILYSLYVNDCEIHFIREKCPSIEINLINLFYSCMPTIWLYLRKVQQPYNT